MTPNSIWLIGSPEAIDTLVDGDLPAQPGVRRLDDLGQARRLLADARHAPDLIVLAQSRPGEFAAATIERVRRAAPLARVWRVAGSWCEGEGRSAPGPAGCLSTYWHQWPARWARELARSQRGEAPSWTLPQTASPEERTLALATEPVARGAGRVAVRARHPASAAALADVCRLGGYELTILDSAGSTAPPSCDCPAVLWDATPEEIANPAAIEKLRSTCGAGPIVAVVGFARPEDCRRAAEAGVAAVVTKPYLVHDLLWELARVCHRLAA